jgi:hypothetical protein
MSADFEPGHRRPEGTELPDPLEPEARPDDRSRHGRRRDAGDGSDPGTGQVAWLLGGALAIAAGTALGWDATAVPQVVTPPPLVRAALVGVSFAAGVFLLLTALTRLAGESEEPLPPPAGYESERDIAGMIRAVRLVFLAVAAFAAATGWAIGHPLPLVVALVIAGVDVLETSFLLVVVALRSSR